MKNITILLALLLMTACNSGKKKPATIVDETNIVTDFLKDISTLEKVEGNGIVQFEALAKTKSAKALPLTKTTVKTVLAEAAKYKHCVIITGNHTIVKITDANKTRASGVWATPMPLVKGYVRKNGMTLKEDYANNIIGIPDNQTRTAYYFN